MAEFTKLDTGFSILKYGDKYNLNYPVFENGKELRKYLIFPTFEEAFNHYKEMRDEQAAGAV